SRLGVLAFAVFALASPVLAQGWKAPPPGPELQAALKKAEAGEPASLDQLANAGDANAQYYAGVLYLFGGPKVAKDPARGCAYEQKASAKRADAMHLVGLCHQNGAGGAPDKVKAEAAYTRAAEMGFPKSKCALGQMLMTEPQNAQRGMALCQQAAAAGDADAQMAVGNAYFNGSAGKPDHAAARMWYEMAAKQNKPDAARKLGEMYARGDGGPKDVKKAMALWSTAEKAGDPLVAILVADQLFSNLTGGKTPGPGTYAFKGGVPVADIEVVEEWYQQALNRDPRPDVKARAKSALSVLASFKTAAKASSARK
ncbi:MAG: tetratricopeptide repeat protein, partial [Phenylobacterium sp.]